MNHQITLSAAPLTWGRGPRALEVFLEPTCPFSARTFAKFEQLLDDAGEHRLTLKIRLHSQTWHLFSAIVTRAILAASTIGDGRQTAKKVMQAVYQHREEFEFNDHCRGPNLDTTPNEILARIARYSMVDVSAPFQDESLNRVMKWHAKYARQNGIHETPTFMVDGLVEAGMSSGDTVERWIEHLNIDSD